MHLPRLPTSSATWQAGRNLNENFYCHDGRTAQSGVCPNKHCPHCGEALKIIVAILEKAAITKILDHLDLPARAPPRAPAQIFDLFEPA